MVDHKLEILVLDLIESLDENPSIKEITLIKDKLYQNNKLKELIINYQNANNYETKVKLKEELYQSKLFRDFKNNEIEINYLIMEINNLLSDLRDRKGCQ